MITLLIKIVRSILNLIFKLLRRTARLALFAALATGVLFILDAFLLDEEPGRRG